MPKQQVQHSSTRRVLSKLASTHSWAIAKIRTRSKSCMSVIPEKNKQISTVFVDTGVNVGTFYPLLCVIGWGLFRAHKL